MRGNSQAESLKVIWDPFFSTGRYAWSRTCMTPDIPDGTEAVALHINVEYPSLT